MTNSAPETHRVVFRFCSVKTKLLQLVKQRPDSTFILTEETDAQQIMFVIM